MIVRQGEKWGALECTHAGKVAKDIRATDAEGNEYIAHREVVNGYHMQCTCGNVLELSKKEFKGKRITRDCGCGAAGFSGENVVITISTNSGVKGHLQQLARLDGQTVSYIANEAFRLYFESRSRSLGSRFQTVPLEQRRSWVR